MTTRLEIVTPPTSPGAFRRAYAALATTRVARRFSRLVNWKLDPLLLRLSGGRFSSTLVFRSAVLETRGARTGSVRRNAVIYFHDDDRVTIVASNAGAPRNPAWFHNLCANPDVTFATIPMRADVIDDETERRRLEALGDRTFPAFAPYRKQAAEAGRTVPIVQLVPADSRQEPA
jgi:deazaflavin-dependent oxidoreductase (nitroreductase family)